MLSMGPVFKNHVHGGSQKILREIAIYLGNQGHTVNIYCTRRDDNQKVFELNQGVTVYPTLGFKQTFPLPYKTSPHNLTEIIQVLSNESKLHDVIYAHDSNMNFPFLYTDVPTVFSLRDFLYQETLVGAFNFEGDEIIVNSEYTFKCLMQTVGQIREGLEERVHLISNGIDTNHFKKTKPNAIYNLMDIKESSRPIILSPHRPEQTKGIEETLQLIYLLKERGMEDVLLLIPRYIDLNISSEPENFYLKIKTIA